MRISDWSSDVCSSDLIKRILAYSTMSQLGLMILALGLGVADAAFLHLITHAFFKACLFLSAGMVIHSLHKAQPSHLHFDVQDIRNMGGLKKYMPVTFATFRSEKSPVGQEGGRE